MLSLFDWKKTIHLVRGLPGEGKSTLALKLVRGNRDQVIENDDFWLLPSGTERISWLNLRQNLGNICQNDIDNMSALKYEYDTRITHVAGHWCWAETFRRLRYYDEVAVANTFIKREYVFHYVNEALRHGVNIKLHRPTTEWAGDVQRCYNTNIHNVPIEVIERMKSQWEDVSQEEIDNIINSVKSLEITCSTST